MEQEHPHIVRAVRLTRLLDQRFLDPLLGLFFPGAGDVVSSALGLYIVFSAARLRLPAFVIARMLINLGIDALIGAIPLAGDLFDFAFRANTRNLALLRTRAVAGSSSLSDRLVVSAALAFFVIALVTPFVILAKILERLF